MLRLFLRSVETYDENRQEFQTIGGIFVDLEHSLYTVAKWEEKHKKPFSQQNVDIAFIMGYLECMCMTEDVPSNYWACLTHKQLLEIVQYIQDPHTATTIRQDTQKRGRNRVITAEIIYCWMINLNIPIAFEHWHFNKLTTLIEVCVRENSPPKKMNKKDALRQQRELNAARRAKYNSKG